MGVMDIIGAMGVMGIMGTMGIMGIIGAMGIMKKKRMDIMSPWQAHYVHEQELFL
jgi:hypothetical protein